MNYPHILSYAMQLRDNTPVASPDNVADFRGMFDMIVAGLSPEACHIFEIERDLAFLMSQTDNDGMGYESHLPYPCTFLDLDVDLDLRGNLKHIIGILLLDLPEPLSEQINLYSLQLSTDET